jgi:SAM-dependent methyltransferase
MKAPTTIRPVDTDEHSDEQRELLRIRAAYERRTKLKLSQRYLRTNPGSLYALHEREAAMARMLRRMGRSSLSGLRILDLGCGRGSTLRLLLEYGADTHLLSGIDLMEDHIQDAQVLSPNLHFSCGSATQLPYADASFDLTIQFLMFTSVLSETARHRIAEEINRVLAPGGHFFWYDFAVNNPRNPDVRGIGLSEIRRLFPGFTLEARRVTVVPPLGRTLGRLGASVYYLAAQLRLLNTHYFCLLRKK